MSVANHSSSDAYVTFDLPSPGSAPAVSDDEVAALCLRWFETEYTFVTRLMRRLCSGWDRDAVLSAASATAVCYLQSLQNRSGLFLFVRDHIVGDVVIREPKALFIRTIELQRRNAVRELMRERFVLDQQAPLDDSAALPSFWPEPFATSPAVRERTTELAGSLVGLAAVAGPAEEIEAILAELASLTHPVLLQVRALDHLTPRQRMVFLLRTDPLHEPDAALGYDVISTLSSIVGRPAAPGALRQQLADAHARLRLHLPQLADRLRHA